MKYKTLVNAKQLINNNNLQQYSIVKAKWTGMYLQDTGVHRN